MQPTQKENHDDSSKDYQNTRKTHIFFGVEDEWGTHPQTPEPTAVANRALMTIVQAVQPDPKAKPGCAGCLSSPG